MKNGIFTCSFLFIAIISINAQSNFRSGYIITNERDTISGLIDFRTYKMNAQFCKFKLSDESEIKEYYPEDIYGYRFTDDGKYYVSKDIEIEGKHRKVFLEYLIQGIISLYFYPGEESDYYFFQDDSGKMISVTKQDKEYVLRETVDDVMGRNTGRYNIEDSKYKGIVRYVFKDSKSVSKATDKMSFKQAEMIDLTKKYHAEMCTTGEECIEFASRPDKYNKMKVSVYAGMQIQSLKVEERRVSGYYRIYPVPHPAFLSPEVGVQINYSIPRWNKSLSFQFDASFAPFKNDTEIQASPQKYSRLKIDGLGVPLKFGGKYTYHKGLFRPVIEGGFMIKCLFISSDIYYGYKYSTGKYEYESDHFLGTHYVMLGLYAGTGFDYSLNKDNSLLFRIVYDDCRLMNTISDRLSTWQLKLGYTF